MPQCPVFSRFMPSTDHLSTPVGYVYFSERHVSLQIYLKDRISLSLHPRTAYYLESEKEYKTMHTYAPGNQFYQLMAYKYSEPDNCTIVPSPTAISV
jgi:hypothetical protein